MSDIEKMLSKDNAPEQQWVDEMSRQYPYFTLPLILRLKHGGDDDAMQRLALMSPDRRDLAVVIGKAPAAFANFYLENEPAAPSSEEAIDTFLNNYGGGSNQQEIDALSKVIFNPTPDYADILAAQAESTTGATNDKEDELISSFIAKSQAQEREAMTHSQDLSRHVLPQDVGKTSSDSINDSYQQDDSMLSESLAKMYIARHKYSKALEIIESINLNFPEKSIYFADQIRFLRKLMLNEETKNKL